MRQAESFMEKWGMLPEPGGLLLCAVSGGRDSVCLLHFLMELAPVRGFRLAAAHYDHRLRGGESERDAAFVRALCADWGIPCAAEAGDVAAEAGRRGLGVEETARLCRYAFLERTADALGAERIATAHHAEDNAETLLLHLVRGSGGGGLAGIPPVRGRLVRPFLTTSRAEIEDYVRAHRLPYVEDGSNSDPRYARNRLRQEVMPALRALNPALTDTLSRSIAVFREENELLEALAAEALGEIERTERSAAAPRERFRQAAPALRPRMALRLFDALGAGRKDVSARNIEAVTALAAGSSPRGSLDLPGGVLARCEGERFLLERRTEHPAARRELLPGEWISWGKYTIYSGKIGKNIPKNRDAICLKYDMINAAVSVGPWKAAARLELPGGRGARTLKRLFSDAGISLTEREELPVIYVGERAAAAYGIGTDRHFLPAEGEESLLLTIERM